jgi:redox-sensitive bicupin YhaK (pirin superfamily)
MPVEALAALPASASEGLLPDQPDGLCAWRHRLPPGAALRGPDPATGDGQFWVITSGTLALNGGAPMPTLSCAFVFPDEAAAAAQAGPGGAEVLVLQYPRGRAHLAPA